MFKKDPKATIKKKYEPTKKAQKFLDKVENPKYDRGMIRGLNKFIGNKIPEEMQRFYYNFSRRYNSQTFRKI